MADGGAVMWVHVWEMACPTVKAVGLLSSLAGAVGQARETGDSRARFSAGGFVAMHRATRDGTKRLF